MSQAGNIIFYDWRREKVWLQGASKNNENYAGATAHPYVGCRWSYFPRQLNGHAGGLKTTEGKVVSFDRKSGVVCTDEGEILMRG